MKTYRIINYLISLFILHILFCSCNSELTDPLTEAGANRSEILSVINHYSKSDSLKFESAKFLLKHLTGHRSIKSTALDSMISILNSNEAEFSDTQKEKLWKELNSNDKIENIPDIKYLKAKDIIANIDTAFNTWSTSPWKADVSFQIFCDYILPHRVMTEMFTPGWREKLRSEYSDIIADETDILRAFAKIHCEVMKRFRNHSLGIPYIAPLKDLGLFGTGSCIQGCVYETAVMRSLGIPAAIDGIEVWSNYSRNGHAWCALVLDNATYTMTKHDTVASKFNVIDSSIFPSCDGLEENYPYSATFKKRAAKINRNRYSFKNVTYSDSYAPDSIRNIFENPYAEDITKDYFKNSISITLQSKYHGYIYLCIWRTNYGWYPMAYANNNEDKFIFENLGDSTIYLPIVYSGGKPKPILNPLLVTNGKAHVLNPKKNNNKSQKITIDRKYPLVGKFIDRWISMRGGKFEVSNTPTFNNPYTIAEINNTPIYRNVYITNKNTTHRYIRYASPKNINFPIAELEIYAEGKKVKGIPFSTGINTPERAFDNDRFKVLENATPGYTVGLDLGKSMKVDSIVMYPQNDDNFIKPGISYELFYYDRGWKSLGKTISHGYSITYNNVPSNALLRLHCTNGGNEERIFTYEDCQQIWW